MLDTPTVPENDTHQATFDWNKHFINGTLENETHLDYYINHNK